MGRLILSCRVKISPLSLERSAAGKLLGGAAKKDSLESVVMQERGRPQTKREVFSGVI